MHVIVTAWKIPEWRIREFVEWNADNFALERVRCLIVTDRDLDFLPPHFDYAIYPRPMDIFNLSACSNFGLKKIGQGVICKTDIDCIFSRPLLRAMFSVSPGRAIAPIYMMCESHDCTGRAWAASCGTIAANWGDWVAAAGYDENLKGYGVEDGDFVARAREAGVKFDRIETIRHVAHNRALKQGCNPRKRPDFWNRDRLNPKNHRENRRARGDWTREDFLKK